MDGYSYLIFFSEHFLELFVIFLGAFFMVLTLIERKRHSFRKPYMFWLLLLGCGLAIATGVIVIISNINEVRPY
ncbi:MAG TPA: hypothetical protein VNJ29_02265 [Candidatus Nitrosotenuis sp.]|nr:hypothetical protein [Candidatus Nitrosotenuis sp.]